MDVLKEFEFLSHQELLMERLKEKYNWVQKRSKEGAKDYFIKQWNEFFEIINDFFIAQDEYVSELKRSAAFSSRREPPKHSWDKSETRTNHRPYNPLNRKAKEAFRDDWNLQQRTKWMDHY